MLYKDKNGLIRYNHPKLVTEEILVEDIAKIYIKEVFTRHKALSKIILDRDLRFIVIF